MKSVDFFITVDIGSSRVVGEVVKKEQKGKPEIFSEDAKLIIASRPINLPGAVCNLLPNPFLENVRNINFSKIFFYIHSFPLGS